MILESIFNLVFGVLNGLISLIPSFDIPAFITGSITGFVNLVRTLEYFFPVGTLFLCISAMVGFQLITLVIWVVNWVVHRIPLVG